MINWRFWWIVNYLALLLVIVLIARHLGRLTAEIITLKAEVSALEKCFLLGAKQ